MEGGEKNEGSLLNQYPSTPFFPKEQQPEGAPGFLILCHETKLAWQSDYGYEEGLLCPFHAVAPQPAPWGNASSERPESESLCAQPRAVGEYRIFAHSNEARCLPK